MIRQVWRFKTSVLNWIEVRKIRPGTMYEDCGYRPMICVKNDRGDLTGVSMIDGKVRCCSQFHCGVVIFKSLNEATKAVEKYREWEEEARSPEKMPEGGLTGISDGA